MEIWGIALIVAGGLLLFGIALIIWGKKEEKNYYNSLTSRVDLREFFSRWPPRPQPGALKVGGWISIIVSLVLAGIGWLLWYLQNE